jgi:2-dehydro-3-deoxyphosphogluconate aldolase/(4S)-4-hydroxy-2-oxoglutarate aldolase
LQAGGLPIIEVTFRTAVAAQVIQLLTRERPDLWVGAGTVLTRENLQAAQSAGARFAVAPGLNPNLVRQARDSGLPFVPGVATPSEIELALALECRLLKFFPAGPLGGVEMVNALSGPYRHTGVRFIPTGGVTPANLETYLACPTVAAVGGTWLAKPEDLAARRWDNIRQRCQTAVEIVRRLRPHA